MTTAPSKSSTDVMVRMREGTAHRQAAIWIDRYEAINLREALEIALDTGDWHGQIRYKLEQALAHLPEGPDGPNAWAADQRKGMGLA